MELILSQPNLLDDNDDDSDQENESNNDNPTVNPSKTSEDSIVFCPFSGIESYTVIFPQWSFYLISKISSTTFSTECQSKAFLFKTISFTIP